MKRYALTVFWILLLLLVARPAQGQDPPATCTSLETITVEPGTTSDPAWSVVGAEAPLIVHGQTGDSARVATTAPEAHRSIVCKTTGGDSFVHAGIFGWFAVDDVTLAILERIDPSNQSLRYGVAVFDHPLRVVGHTLHAELGASGLHMAGLASVTDVLVYDPGPEPAAMATQPASRLPAPSLNVQDFDQMERRPAHMQLARP